jgi:uncharacterized protein (DUF362 family)
MFTMIASREFYPGARPLSRREFVRQVGCAAAGLALLPERQSNEERPKTPVTLVKGQTRPAAIRKAVDLLGPLGLAGRDVYLKASYNSQDPFPASTHPETLRTVVRTLRDMNCRRIFLVERSGMGITTEVWQGLGIPDVVKGLQVTLLPLESLETGQWRREELQGSHWKRGVEVPWFLTTDACVVQISNLKTHRFGGIFSASLKNSVGLIAKRGQVDGSPYNYMEELHSSADQRLMIAEVNQTYKPALIVMDATQVFIDGGPDGGRVAQPEAMLASQDRVAIDVAGAALLRVHGAVGALGRTYVFKQDQIKRAVELELGVKSAQEIQFLPADEPSRELMYRLNASLMEPAETEKP